MVATRTTNGTQTISGVHSGQAIILGHKTTAGGHTSCYFKVLEGANIATAPNTGDKYHLGMSNYGTASVTIIATATTVKIQFWDAADDKDTIYIYKDGS